MASANLPVGASATPPPVSVAGSNVEQFARSIEDFAAAAAAIFHASSLGERGIRFLDDPGPFAEADRIDVLISTVVQKRATPEVAIALLDVYASGFADESRGPTALLLLGHAVKAELQRDGFSAPVLARAILDVTTDFRRMPEPAQLIDRIGARRRHALNLIHWRDRYADLVGARARRAAKAPSL